MTSESECPTVFINDSAQGQAGVLSYAEIESYIKKYKLNTEYDKAAQTKYLAFDEDQWVSYDDAETLQKKVDYANEQGYDGTTGLFLQQLTLSSLLGLFIWAIDLDDREHNALKALLGGKLGTFAQQNGYDPTFSDDDSWEGITGNACSWSSKISLKVEDATQISNRDSRLRSRQVQCRFQIRWSRTVLWRRWRRQSQKADSMLPTQGLYASQRMSLQADIVQSTPNPETCHWAGGKLAQVFSSQFH
jgi:hypothetical protein